MSVAIFALILTLGGQELLNGEDAKLASLYANIVMVSSLARENIIFHHFLTSFFTLIF